ncbi:Acetyltransferase (GNAT) family protein [compost metagenome]
MSSTITWRIVPFTELHGRDICTWIYPTPYDLYNWPSWDYMVKEGQEFADPSLRQAQYAAAINEHGILSGYVQFFPILGVTRLGLGLRPELCGQGSGIGTTFVQLLVQEAYQRAPRNEIDLEVLTWNKRAIQTYEKAGFEITDTYERMTPNGSSLFHCMVYSKEL